MNGGAILGAVRGVIRGELGSIRVVPPSTFGEGPPAPHVDADESRYLLSKLTKRFDVELSPPRRHPGLGPSTASRALLEVELVVVLTYSLPSELEDLAEQARFDVRALAADDANTITQALEWPGNLLVDGSAVATSLVSAKLRAIGTPAVRREDWHAGIYEVALTFSGLLNEVQAVA